MNKCKNLIIDYIKSNLKNYILVFVIYVIGVLIGVFMVNITNDTEVYKSQEHIIDFINTLKEQKYVEQNNLIIKTVKRNAIIVFALWISGTTIVCIPIICITLIIRGVCLGCTLANIALVLGKIKGILFCLGGIFLQNILFIPAILTISVSGINLYKEIIKKKEKSKIKIEVIKHISITGLMILVIIISSIIESYISTKIIQNMIKYF